VDLRTRTSLFCGALALAIAISMLLRMRPRRAQWFFAAFSADIGLWYVAQWLYLLQLSPIWAHFTAVLVVLMPQFAVHLFEAPGSRYRESLARCSFRCSCSCSRRRTRPVGCVAPSSRTSSA
jgi:hypothetical protein